MILLGVDIDGPLANGDHAVYRQSPEGVARRERLFQEYPNDPQLALGLHLINPDKVKLLGQFTRDTGAKLLITSTWRENQTTDHFNALFRLCDPDFPEAVIGLTPLFEDRRDRTRGHEIDTWMQDNHYAGQFAALDDCGPGGYLPHQRLFQTDFYKGLTVELVTVMRAYFGA